MIKLEYTEVVGWEVAIRGMRNPHNSWDKSDSKYLRQEDRHIIASRYEVGPNDHDLMMRLVKAGTDHRKFMRMIVVYVDVTAPLYWISELDTYKVGTVRNSCSFMHKGVSRPFTIRDFSVFDERIYDVLSKPEKTVYKRPIRMRRATSNESKLKTEEHIASTETGES